MDDLCGWTIAVTADHRAPEQAELLQRRGADVVLAPLVEARPADHEQVRAATRELVSAPVDLFVPTTATGLRTWLAMAWAWDLGEVVLDRLREAEVAARGAATIGVLVGEDVPIPTRPAAPTLGALLDELVTSGIAGRRVGVQLSGGDLAWFTDGLRAAGAEVVPIPVYELVPTPDTAAATRLSTLAARGELDALTCTSAAAARSLGSVDGLVDALRAAGTAVACTGPAPAAVLGELGLTDVVVASPHRLGAMVRALGERIGARGRTIEVAGITMRHQGSRVHVSGHGPTDPLELRLTPRERRVLEAILAVDGAVVSKQRLAASAWDEAVDDHTVEVAINRLRRKLGPAAVALETTNRRGYRIAR